MSYCSLFVVVSYLPFEQTGFLTPVHFAIQTGKTQLTI